LVINQSWHHGWRAFIDGQPAAVVRVNGDFFGCVAAQGNHRVEFRFEPPGLRHGMMFGFAGLACMVLGVLWLGRSRQSLNCNKEHKL
jgi:uncharacterized membrane protein YfhO